MEVHVYRWVTIGKKKFGLVNKHKTDNVAHVGRKGQDGSYTFPKTDKVSDALLIALYDKHGGLIVDEKYDRVEMFTFWDLVAGKPKGAKGAGKSGDEGDASKSKPKRKPAKRKSAAKKKK